jgi:hypothetical protein
MAYFGTIMALIQIMKAKRKINNKMKLPIVSQIVQTKDQDGRDVLGFTVQVSEDSFYNVLRPFTNETYTLVYEALSEERTQILINGKLKEKKK